MMLCNDHQSLNKANWENLLDLYKKVQSSTRVIIKHTTPVLSYKSSGLAWPNFSIINDVLNDYDDLIEKIQRAININTIPPVILLNPSLPNQSQITDALEQKAIRQIDVWPVIYFEMSKGLPKLTPNPDLRIELVTCESELMDWNLVASQVLFKGKELPINGFLNQDFKLLVGYLDSEPVATTMLFVGSEYPSVHMVAVLPHHMKKGIGKRIFARALEISADLKAKRVFAQASRMGTKPWLELGFEISGYLNVFWQVGISL